MYRILNSLSSSGVKELFITVGDVQSNYDLRNSGTDLVLQHPRADFLKKALNLVARNYGMASL